MSGRSRAAARSLLAAPPPLPRALSKARVCARLCAPAATTSGGPAGDARGSGGEGAMTLLAARSRAHVVCHPRVHTADSCAVTGRCRPRRRQAPAQALCIFWLKDLKLKNGAQTIYVLRAASSLLELLTLGISSSRERRHGGCTQLVASTREGGAAARQSRQTLTRCSRQRACGAHRCEGVRCQSSLPCACLERARRSGM